MSKKDEFKINTEELEELDFDELKLEDLPIIPLRDQIMVPYIIFPIIVGRKGSIEAVQKAIAENNNKIFSVTQKKNAQLDKYPAANDLYRYGCICSITQMFKLPDGTMRIILQGEYKAKVLRYNKTGNFYTAKLDICYEIEDDTTIEFKSIIKTFHKYFKEYVKLNKNLPTDMFKGVSEIKNAQELYYFTLANLEIPLVQKQILLEIEDINIAFKKLIEIIFQEIEVLKLQNDLEQKVKIHIAKSQKEYFLNEQLKIIHRELGMGESEADDLSDLKSRIVQANLSDEARKKAEEEFKKLSRLSPHMPEYFVVFHYLNWILDLPWQPAEFKDIDLNNSQEILDRDHYGLEKVKERILEYLAIMKISDKIKGQILCFVGPPGVGKTSLGKSIAEALGREFIRLSLGGVRDEAEIRGHRRTYIGAIPGVVIQSMKKAGTRNPLIMMDEIDKLSSDFRGDPASALLEVLDPEQNKSFRDHYLDFGFDLSSVMFITTANSTSSIPRPLLDRMEIISIPGYTEIEKREIALRHLLKKKVNELTLEDRIKINIDGKVIQEIIRKYTRESGVRELERKIGTILRKLTKEYVDGKIKDKVTIDQKKVEDYLGAAPFVDSEIPQKDGIGVVVGLAWTQVGGEILTIEALKFKGSGKIVITGHIGQVMQESAKAAYSYARNHAEELGIDPDFYKKTDIHIHVPEGAVPKDGPSAGVSMATALISLLSDRKVFHNVAMTGEITLTGRVLAIGGLTEKLMAAKRSGVNKVIIPKQNYAVWTEVKDEIKENIEFIFAETIDDVLAIAIEPLVNAKSKVKKEKEKDGNTNSKKRKDA